MFKEIRQAAKDGNGNALIFTALGAAILSNCIPAPSDALVFWDQERIKNLLEQGKITPKQYWIKDIAIYYGYTAGWYLLVLIIMLGIKSPYTTKIKVGLGLVASGMVVAVVAKNIQKDNLSLKYKKGG